MLVHMQRVDARNMDMQYKPEKKRRNERNEQRGKSKKSGSHRVRICGFSNGIYTDAEPVIFRAGSVRCEYGKADGEAKDIAHGIPFAGQMKIYAGTYDDAADAAIIIITAGANQKPGETRLDLVQKNTAIYQSIIPEIVKRDFGGILLIVSNPVDILTYVALKLSGLPENRVLGSGTVLDTGTA